LSQIVVSPTRSSRTFHATKTGTVFRFALDYEPMRNAQGTNGLRVLGVDPAASGPTGYGVIECTGRRYSVLRYGAFRVDAGSRKESSGRGLAAIHDLLCSLIQEFSPTVMAVESIFSALNVHTALRLAEVRGVVLLTAAQHGLPVHSYSPREVKASVAGYGHADKRQIQVMVRALLSMRELPQPADAADALAVALCYLQMEQARQRFGLPNGKALIKPRPVEAMPAVSSKRGSAPVI
jgi:crossover junction endodeoxyribonuclease RuvC